MTDHNTECTNMTNGNSTAARPTRQATTTRTNIGVLAMAIYFPKTYVSQSDLELYDKVGAGKYTKGLMQEKMSFCTDLEDINSIALTVLKKLLEQTKVPLGEIGYLAVGTETILDKSKSIKTVLMQLFEQSGHTDIEGVDTINACYGGTAALFHAIDHCSSPHSDGRLAIVIAADIAVYDKGSARPTGGCGAVAMLIGPNAALVFDPMRATQMTNTYDFYKPDPSSEYPIVDGKLSLQAYIAALDKCSEIYHSKWAAAAKQNGRADNKQLMLLDEFSAILFHSPYCKLVRKAFARLVFNESCRRVRLAAAAAAAAAPTLDDSATTRVASAGERRGSEMSDEMFRCCDNKLLFERVVQASSGQLSAKSSSLKYKDWIGAPVCGGTTTTVEKLAIQLSEQAFKEKTEASLYLSQQIGNMYTASLYSCLIAYLTSKPIEQLANNKVLLFSYGSGSAASMFSARLTGNLCELEKLVASLRDVQTKLTQRVQVSPSEFSAHLEHRKRTFSLPNRYPTGKPTSGLVGVGGVGNCDAATSINLDTYLYPNTYYLTAVDGMFRRRYARYALDGVLDSGDGNGDGPN